jgi:alpha-galactosidase
MQRSNCLLVLLILTLLSASAQKFEGLAKTPPMGWNSWNKFGCDVDEKKLMAAADAMVASGMKDAGYQYIVIDDCWQVSRDSLGFIVADPERFPSGIKALADYVHFKGLKFGIYSCAGNKTCGGRPAGRGHEYQDALSYARWGVDYLKYDWCNTGKMNAEEAYITMRDALYSAGRPIVFSLCEWGNNKPWLWGAAVGHLWRTTGDIWSCFDCIKDNGSWHANGVMQIVDMQDGLRKYAGPGHWNDPDMLEVGNGMTENEDRAHFTLWCLLAAPLMAGNDLSAMPDATKFILTNKEAIAVNQDSLGIQGFKYASKDSVETWLKPLVGGSWAFCLLNRSKKEHAVTVDWKTLIVKDSLSGKELDAKSQLFTIRDLWLHCDLGDTKKTMTVSIPAHDVLCFRLDQKKK